MGTCDLFSLVSSACVVAFYAFFTSTLIPEKHIGLK